MILPHADWQDRAGLRALAATLGSAGADVRYVGGAVRDTLLGHPVADIDLATTFPPEETVRRLRSAGIRAVPTGIAHGTITAILPDGPVEITTLRRDVATDGRHAEVAFTDDWREDAARRDFTINALFADPVTGELFDYFGGLDDLAAARVRFIGDPLTRIAEDHLRILRFFRFHARFGQGLPDAEGLAACTTRANDLMALSRERIAQELLKLLGVRDPEPTVRVMVERGILRPVLPEIDMRSVASLNRLVSREIEGGDPVRRLAALLPPDAALADAVAVRLKLSNAQRKRLAVAAVSDVAAPPRALAYAVGLEGALDRLLLHAGDDELGPALSHLRKWVPPKLPLTGGALIRLGLTPGPDVARTLRGIEQQWVDEGFPNASRVDAIARAAVDQAVRERK